MATVEIQVVDPFGKPVGGPYTYTDAPTPTVDQQILITNVEHIVTSVALSYDHQGSKVLVHARMPMAGMPQRLR